MTASTNGPSRSSADIPVRPADIRNATWHSLQQSLRGRRLQVWRAWRRFGIGTTRQLAAHSGLDILTVRPRTTELCQLGLLFCAFTHISDDGIAEGVYRPMTAAEWYEWRSHQFPTDAQLRLI